MVRVEGKGPAAVQTDEDTGLFQCPRSVGATVHEGHSFITCFMVSWTKKEGGAKG